MISYTPKAFIRNDDGERFVYRTSGYVNEEMQKWVPDHHLQEWSYEVLAINHSRSFHVSTTDGYIVDQSKLTQADIEALVKIAKIHGHLNPRIGESTLCYDISPQP